MVLASSISSPERAISDCCFVASKPHRPRSSRCSGRFDFDDVCYIILCVCKKEKRSAYKKSNCHTHTHTQEPLDEELLQELKRAFMDAYDNNRDGRIDIRELAQLLPIEESFKLLFKFENQVDSSVEFMRVSTRDHWASSRACSHTHTDH